MIAPAGSGATFGVEVDAVWRWQTFEATKDGVIDSVEVYVVKKKSGYRQTWRPKRPRSIRWTAASPLMKRCKTVTVPETQVNDKAPTSIDFDVQVEAGKRYALALTADPAGQQDPPITKPTYDWEKKDLGLDLPSGKIRPEGNWVDEASLAPIGASSITVSAIRLIYLMKIPPALDLPLALKQTLYGVIRPLTPPRTA